MAAPPRITSTIRPTAPSGFGWLAKSPIASPKAASPMIVATWAVRRSTTPIIGSGRNMTTFQDLGLSEDILSALRDVGYESPSPIQEQAIPHLLQGHDVIGQAQTGTGKTAAFGLPMIQFVDPSDADVQALVLTPTRELCIQVTQALRAYARPKGIEPVAVFGGAPIRDQQARLKTGGQIV